MKLAAAMMAANGGGGGDCLAQVCVHEMKRERGSGGSFVIPLPDFSTFLLLPLLPTLFFTSLLSSSSPPFFF